MDIPNIPGIQLTYGPIWHSLYWPIVVVVFLLALIAAVQLIRPVWTRAQSAARLVVDISTVTLAGALVVFHPWVSIIAPALAPAAVAGISLSINGILTDNPCLRSCNSWPPSEARSAPLARRRTVT